jgi:hypothetical protein
MMFIYIVYSHLKELITLIRTRKEFKILYFSQFTHILPAKEPLL